MAFSSWSGRGQADASWACYRIPGDPRKFSWICHSLHFRKDSFHFEDWGYKLLWESHYFSIIAQSKLPVVLVPYLGSLKAAKFMRNAMIRFRRPEVADKFGLCVSLSRRIWNNKDRASCLFMQTYIAATTLKLGSEKAKTSRPRNPD